MCPAGNLDNKQFLSLKPSPSPVITHIKFVIAVFDGEIRTNSSAKFTYRNTSDGSQAKTYIHQLSTDIVYLLEDLLRAMANTNGWRERERGSNEYTLEEKQTRKIRV